MSINRPPKLIDAIIHHALGSNRAFTEHYYDWLAAIAQDLPRKNTVWVLSGTMATGKTLTVKIFENLFGHESTYRISAQHLGENLNHITLAGDDVLCVVEELRFNTWSRFPKDIQRGLDNVIAEGISGRGVFDTASPKHKHHHTILITNHERVTTYLSRTVAATEFQNEPLDLSFLDVSGAAFNEILKEDCDKFREYLMVREVRYDFGGNDK